VHGVVVVLLGSFALFLLPVCCFSLVPLFSSPTLPQARPILYYSKLFFEVMSPSGSPLGLVQ